MILPILAVLVGLAILGWGADKFVEGAAVTARQLGMPPLLIGMLIIGFGTSAPEIVVSIIAALDGASALALGNAYGSNITNIALILGLTAIVLPIGIRSNILKKELPVLVLVTGLSAYQVWDGLVSRIDGAILVVILFALLGWSIYEAKQGEGDSLEEEFELEIIDQEMPLKHAIFWIFVGMLLLVVSSRTIVWGAVEIAHAFGVSDLIIGLTVVAIGTSLPELASSIAAVRKGENDIVLGNIIGSNLFNTLAVVGIAALIHPIHVESDVITRDIPVMCALTVSILLLGGIKLSKGKIGRVGGALLVTTYVVYTLYLISTVFVS